MSAKITCPQCQKQFAKTYFGRHWKECATKEKSTTANDLSFFNESSSDEGDDDSFHGFNGDDGLEISANSDTEGVQEHDNVLNFDIENIIPDDELEELMEDFTVPRDLPREDLPLSSVILVTWFCLFLALWQYVFGITDTALEHLIKFMKAFFTVLGNRSDDLLNLAALMPPSLYLFRKRMECELTQFEKYVVCQKCFKLYKMNECIEKIRGITYSKKCNNILFPNHPSRQYRKPCGQLLMMTFETSSGRKLLYPLKTYCYMSIQKSLKILIERPGFLNKCEEWRTKPTYPNIMSDIYDGNLWKEFDKKYNFFSEKNNLGVMLNVDWFCPFKRIRSYSVGAIYMVITNLPRTERFKRENVILVGIIPSMKKEPPTNTFLEPLIAELQVAWNEGFCFNVPSADTNPTKVKLALICVGCDIPACRKLCGFLGHNARQGCSRCKRSFPGSIGTMDFSGFDRNDGWTKRTTEEHRLQMQEILASKTKGEKEKLESLYGTRFCIITRLEYYDSIRMAIVDPMHNLFLGTTKYLINLWKELGYLNDNTLKTIQERVDKAQVPSDVGKLPGKIDKFSFDEFTGDELKNFLLLFSIYCLHDILPKRHLECLRKFVIACSYLCNRIISEADITIADHYLMSFCKDFELIYGKNRVTPNMHLHGHLNECIKDYGPIYSFWLFSFERYNGLLGNIPSNKKSIELQIMNRFCRDNAILGCTTPVEYRENLQPHMKRLGNCFSDRGTLRDITLSSYVGIMKLSSRDCDFTQTDWSLPSYAEMTGKIETYTLSESEHRCLRGMYSVIFPNYNNNDILVPLSGLKSKTVSVNNSVFGAKYSRSHRSSYITAYWCNDTGNIQPYPNMYLEPQPGIIQYFLKHIIYIKDVPVEHLLAFVEWYLPANYETRYMFGKPVELWRADLCRVVGSASFIPVQRIKSKFVHIPVQIQSRNLLVVVARDRCSI